MSKDGLKEFCMQLDKIAAQAGKAEYVKEAGQFVRGAAVVRCPGNSGYLRDNIYCNFNESEEAARSEVYTNVSYAPYVELGTGPRGAASHDGISPQTSPAYTTEPWWIHESQVDQQIAEQYHWPYIKTDQGRFYVCSGQPAHPFMYPALKDNEQKVLRILEDGMNKILEGAGK